ncbi:MAG: hypothetical protein J3R72DRAFT_424477 [Linnemannia gamsii]|nr:MAG: hypothetical protein J3R72DRAFT_424477 [Linnemannia gamsii]
MLKSSLFTLALAASAISADPTLSFYSDARQGGKQSTCYALIKLDRCYRIERAVANTGLSSASFFNKDLNLENFSVTLYSGNGCNGRFDRWSFNRLYISTPYEIDYFRTLNDKVLSFKIENRQISTTSGDANADEERTYEPDCQITS